MGEIAALFCQPLNFRHQSPGASAGVGNESAKFAKLHMLIGSYTSGHLLLDGRQQFRFQIGYLSQSRYII